LKNITSFGKDRCSFREGKGSGVIFYVNNNIISYVDNEVSNCKSGSVWCKLKTSRTILVIGVCYKSQTASENDIGELFSTIAIAAKGDLLIKGDFNYPKLIGKHWIEIHLEINFLIVLFICMLENRQGRTTF